MSFISRSSNPSEPFLDPLNAQHIRCPATFDMGPWNGARIVRLLDKDTKESSNGAWYDKTHEEFVLDIAQLTKRELEDRVHLAIKKQGQKVYAHFKLANLVTAPTSLARQLQGLAPSFEQNFQVTVVQQVKAFLQETRHEQVTRYKEIYELALPLIQKTSPSPSQQHPTDFSKMYSLPDYPLNPRDYSFTVYSDSNEEEKGLDPTEGESFKVHGCVIQVNGGNLVKAFVSEMREGREKTMQIKVSSPTVLEKLIQYLYGKPIAVETDKEAVELYHLADQWEMLPLKEQCWHTAALYHLKEIHPSKIPPLENFGFGDSVEKMIQAADAAQKHLQRTYETHLKPHVDRLIQQYTEKS